MIAIWLDSSRVNLVQGNRETMENQVQSQQVKRVTLGLPGDLVEASNIFRKAAGVFKHLEEHILPPMQPRLPPERPPEATVSMAKIWATLCLAEAQVCPQKIFQGFRGLSRCLRPPYPWLSSGRSCASRSSGVCPCKEESENYTHNVTCSLPLLRSCSFVLFFATTLDRPLKGSVSMARMWAILCLAESTGVCGFETLEVL